MLEVVAKILALLVAVNAAPILAASAMGATGGQPLDGGRRLGDGYALFGSAKTWRGVFAALAMAAVFGGWLGFGIYFSLIFGILVMVGDLFSSFVKRRQGLAPSAQSLGLDQLPEAILPCAYAVVVLELPWWWLVLLPLIFSVLELLVSRPLYWMKIRKRPY